MSPHSVTYVSLCQRVIVHPLILNAWLPIGHYEISSPLQLSSMSLEALNVSLLQQAGLTFVQRTSPMPPGSPTVRRPKSRDLKPANPPHWWHLSCDIPPSPIHTRSKAAERRESEGMGSRFGFFCGSVAFDWANNATGGGFVFAKGRGEVISGRLSVPGYYSVTTTQTVVTRRAAHPQLVKYTRVFRIKYKDKFGCRVAQPWTILEAFKWLLERGYTFSAVSGLGLHHAIQLPGPQGGARALFLHQGFPLLNQLLILPLSVPS